MKTGLFHRLLVVLSIAWFVIWIGGFWVVEWFLLEDQTLAEATGLSTWLFFIIYASTYFVPVAILWSLYAVGYWIGHEEWPFTLADISDWVFGVGCLGFIAAVLFVVTLLHPLLEPFWVRIENAWYFQDWHPWLQSIGNGIEGGAEFVLAGIAVGVFVMLSWYIYEEYFQRESDQEND